MDILIEYPFFLFLIYIFLYIIAYLLKTKNKKHNNDKLK